MTLRLLERAKTICWYSDSCQTFSGDLHPSRHGGKLFANCVKIDGQFVCEVLVRGPANSVNDVEFILVVVQFIEI